MYKVSTTHRFEKDLLRCKRRNYDMSLLSEAVSILAKTGTLPEKYRSHKLSGKFTGCWECHIKSDWLMVWRQNNEELTLLFTNTGTHSDLF